MSSCLSITPASPASSLSAPTARKSCGSCADDGMMV
jgi:hypothetical protein